MKKLLLALTVFICASVGNAATIVLQSGNPNVAIKVNPTTNASAVAGGVVLGFFKGYTSAMNAAIGGDGSEFRSFMANTFVPLGLPNSDVDYGTQAAANPVRLLNSLVAGETTATGTLENSAWLASSASILANSVQDGGLVRGTRIFLVAYNGGSLESATDMGIFSASTWTLSTSAAVNTLSMSLTQVDLSTEVYRGALGSLVMAPIVPEPSTSLMALFAGMGLIARRRR